MSNQTNEATYPAAEKVKAQEMSVNLAADLTLAGMPVTVYGQYNIHSNCYYPSQITPRTALFDELEEGKTYDLEQYCLAEGYDFQDTHDEIQEAVENRDR